MAGLWKVTSINGTGISKKKYPNGITFSDAELRKLQKRRPFTCRVIHLTSGEVCKITKESD
jgi:hypothetical protein